MSESKFGVESDEIIPLCKKIANYSAIRLVGIASHIGSQIVELAPFIQTIERLLDIYQQLAKHNFTIEHINLGGGLGITYQNEQPPAIDDYAKAVQTRLSSYPLEVIIEPGRAIVGNAGALLTRVEYLKHHRAKNFAIVDAGMNDLLRPALYSAWHDILPASFNDTKDNRRYDIAGPVCESADFFGKDRELSLKPGDLLAIDSAGAYGFSMSSNYNSRGRPAEVLVDDTHIQLIRKREQIEELFIGEKFSTKERIAQ